MRFASELDDFADLLRATADNLNLPIAFVEKDYYAIRALRALQEQIGNQFIFKGGTSLSKGWNLIDRFSEDLDLLFFREENGKELSLNARHKHFKRAEAIVAETPGFTLVREGKPSSETGMHRESLFSYALSQEPYGPVSDKIKLEMGCRGGTQPHLSCSIRSFVTGYVEAQRLPLIADDLTPFAVECLDITRTFIEKIFAVHSAFEANQAAGKTRHYSDLFRLAERSEIVEFLGSKSFFEVFADVRVYSLQHWPDGSIPNERGLAQCPAFNPPPKVFAALSRNYAAERALYYRPPPNTRRDPHPSARPCVS